MKSKIIKSFIGLIAIIFILWLLDEPVEVANMEETTETRPLVSVVSVQPSIAQTQVNVTGLVKSRWPVMLNANVSGQVINSFEDIQPGSFVEKGALLAQIDDIDYQAALSDAKANVAAAKLELARVLNEQSVAKRIDNGKTNSDYGLFKPHVEAAKANLAAAKARVAAAQKQLNDTQVKAPFNAIVLAKHIVPSKRINQEETLYILASSNALDVEVSLSQQQWQKLDVSTDTSASVNNGFGQSIAAQMRYIAPKLNSQTRQRELTLTIDQPFDSQHVLLPEQHVDVTFSSKPIENVVVTPSTVLTRDNHVWTVKNSRLAIEQVTLIEESDASVVFSFVKQPALARQVVLYPLSTMLEGQEVSAKQATADIGE